MGAWEINCDIPKVLLAADNDRDMLEYLHDAFSSQVNVCDNCGHETATSECDSASDLCDYLSHFPTPPQPIYDEAKERAEFEEWIWSKYRDIYWYDLDRPHVFKPYKGGFQTEFLNVRWESWLACAQSRAKSVEVKSD